MALFNCPECGKEISDKACSCPGCGFPIRHDNFAETAKEVTQEELQQCPKCNFSFPVSQDQCPRCGCRLVPGEASHIYLGKIKDLNHQNSSSALAIASIALGIVGLITSCLAFGIICDVAAVIFAIIALATKKNNIGFSIAGLVTGLVGIVLFLFCAIITGEMDTESEKEIVRSKAESNKPEPETETEEKIVEKVAVEGCTIYEGNGVTIRLDGLEEKYGNYYVDFFIENNSQLNLGFNAHSYAVNNIMTRDSIYAMNCDVAAGKKANTEIVIDESFLNNYDIDTIKTIDVLFWAYDNDAMFKEFDTGQIEIRTNMYDETVDSIVGERLYEENGIIVDYIGNDGDSYTYCLTNNTGNYFNFDVSNISINDYTVSDTDYDLYDEQVLNNCQIVFTINVSQNFKEKNGIESVGKIEFNFDIRPAGDYFNNWLSSTIVHGFD